MKSELKTGKAYACFNYEGRWTQLVGDLSNSTNEANFTGNNRLDLKVIDDIISTANMGDRVREMYDCEREEFPATISQLAETTEVRGSVVSGCSQETFNKLSKKPPIKASNLRYKIMAEAPEVSSSEFDIAPNQGEANMLTAGMLETVLSFVANMERKGGASDVAKYAVFYQDDREKVEQY